MRKSWARESAEKVKKRFVDRRSILASAGKQRLLMATCPMRPICATSETSSLDFLRDSVRHSRHARQGNIETLLYLRPTKDMGLFGDSQVSPCQYISKGSSCYLMILMTVTCPRIQKILVMIWRAVLVGHLLSRYVFQFRVTGFDANQTFFEEGSLGSSVQMHIRSLLSPTTNICPCFIPTTLKSYMPAYHCDGLNIDFTSLRLVLTCLPHVTR